MKKLLMAVLAVAGAMCAFAAADSKTDSFKVYFAERAKGPIAIDGKFDEADWKTAEPILDWGDTTYLGRKPVAKPETWVKYLWDDKYLYLAVRLGEEDFPEENMKLLRKKDFNRSQPVFARDCLELHIDGNNDRHTRYQVWLSPTEEHQIWWYYDFGWGILKDEDYGLNADWDYRVCLDEKGWQIEARFALAHFEMTGKVGNICAIEPCRFRLNKHMRGADGKDLGITTRLWSWATQGCSHKEVEKYGKIIFAEKKPKDIVEGLRLVYQDLDARKIFVQTATEYNLVEKGAIKKIPYRLKAEEALASSEKVFAQAEAFLKEPFSGRSYHIPNLSNRVVKARAEWTAHQEKLAAQPACDIGTLTTISTWSTKQKDVIESAYWSAQGELICKEKKARHPVKLVYDPTLPTQADEEKAYPDPATRKYPCIEWATNLAIQPGKTLVIVNQWAEYDAYSLVHRLGLDADFFHLRTVEAHSDVNYDYWHEGLYSSAFYQKLLENQLAQNHYDNFVFLGCTPSQSSSRLQCWFLERVLEGRKMVFVCDGWQHWLFSGQLKPEDELKDGTLQEIPSVVRGDDLFTAKVQTLKPTGLKTCTFGKGTITSYDPGMAQCYLVYCTMSHSPFLWPNRAFDDEYLYGAAVRAIMQGLGLRGDRRALKLTVGIDGTTEANVGFDANLLVAGAAPWSGKIRYEVRDTWGKVVQPAKDVAVQVAEGKKHISLAVNGQPAGRFVVSAWMLDGQNGGVLDFVVGEANVKDKSGSKCNCSPTCRTTMPPAKIAEVKPAKACFEEKENISALVKIDNAVAGMEIEAQIRDVRKRIIEKAKFPIDLEQGTAAVQFSPKRLLDGCSFLEVKLLQPVSGDAASRRVNGGYKVIAEAAPIDFFRHVPKHDDYEIFADPCDYGGLQGDNRDAILQYFGVQLYQTSSKMPSFRGGNPVFRNRVSGNVNDKGGSMANPYYAEDLRKTFTRQAKALRSVSGHFFSLGDDSGDARAFGKNSPDWLPAFADSLREKFAEEVKKDPKKSVAQLGIEWVRSRNCKFPSGSYWNWSFLFSHVLKDVNPILQSDLQPDDIARFRRVLPKCYKSIEHFNRHNGVNFKSYDEINAQTIKTLKPHPMPEFLNFCYWLQDRYGKDIAKLNAHWNSNFKDFFAIDDAWIDNQKFKKNFTPSIVRAIYLEDNFINQFRVIAGSVRSVDPSMGVGLCASSLGNAMPEVLEHLNTVGNYLGGEEIEVARCLPHVYVGETIGVYGGRNIPLAMREREVYHGLFSGCNFSWFWATCLAINGNLSLHPNRSRRQLETYREVTRGIGALCVRAKRQNDGIRILASRTAGRIQPLRAGSCTHEQARRSFGALIEDLGLQYDYITTHQLEKGMPSDAKVLILASVQSLTDKELAAVKAFVKRGGHVLCNEEPAFVDNYGKALVKPMLDQSEYTLLGFKPAIYTFLRGRGELGTMRTDTLAMFAKWGIKPQFKTLNAKGEEVTNVEYSRFVRDGITCLGYEKIANSFETSPMAATLKLEKPQYVYEVRSGKSYGLTDAAPITLNGLDCLMFAILPYEVKGVAVDAPKTITRGDSLVVKAKVEKVGGESRSTKDVSTHVLRFELVPPGGYSEERFAPVKPRVVDAPKGAATVEFPIAYNEAVDYFDLVVTDVMTGKSTTQRINLP